MATNTRTLDDSSPVNSSSPEKAPTENIFKSEHCHAYKIVDQTIMDIPENERQSGNGEQPKDIERGDKIEVTNDMKVEGHEHDTVNDAANDPILACAEELNLKLHEEEIQTGSERIQVIKPQDEEPNLKTNEEENKTGSDKIEAKSDINADEHDQSVAYNATNVPSLACADKPSLKVHEEEIQAGGDKTEVINDINVDEHDDAMAKDAEKTSTPACTEEASLLVHEEEITGADKIEAANDINIGEHDHNMADNAVNVQILACTEELNPKFHEEEIKAGGDKTEVINGNNIGEHDHDVASDAANMSRLACAEQPNLKVNAEENETGSDKIEIMGNINADEHDQSKACDAANVPSLACAEEPSLMVHEDEIQAGGDKTEAINDINVDEHDYAMANDAENISTPACAEEPGLKVQEEQIKTGGDQIETANDINVIGHDRDMAANATHVPTLACAEELILKVHEDKSNTRGGKIEVINDNDKNISEHDHNVANDAVNVPMLACAEELNPEFHEEEIKTGGDRTEVINDKNIDEHDHDVASDAANISRLVCAEQPNLKVHEEENETGSDKIEVTSDINADEHDQSMEYGAANVPNLACAEEPSHMVHEEQIQTGGDKTEAINDINVDEHDYAIANDAGKSSTPACAEEPSLKVHEEEIKTGGDQIEVTSEINVGEQDHDMDNAVNVPTMACAEEPNLKVHEEKIETRGDKIEVINDINEHDHNMANDAVNVPILARAEEPNLTFHEREIKTEGDKTEVINDKCIGEHDPKVHKEEISDINESKHDHDMATNAANISRLESSKEPNLKVQEENETRDEKIEVINDVNVDEHDDNIASDAANISRLACAEEPNLKVHEKENETGWVKTAVKSDINADEHDQCMGYDAAIPSLACAEEPSHMVHEEEIQAGGDKTEAINDINVEEHDEAMANDAEKVSRPACAEEPSLKVHEEEIKTEGDKVEAANDINVGEHEHDHDMAYIAANVPMLACAEELNPKVHEEEIKTGGDKTEVINDINIGEHDHDLASDKVNIPRLTSAEEPNQKVHKEEIEIGGDKIEVISGINVSKHDHDMTTDEANISRLKCSEEPNWKIQEENNETGGDKIEVITDVNVDEHDHHMASDAANISRPACSEEQNLKVHEEEIDTGSDKTEIKSDTNADEHEQRMAYSASNVPRLACAGEPSLKVHEEEIQAGGDKTEVMNDINVDEEHDVANDAEKISRPACAEEPSLQVHEEEIKTGGDKVEVANDINVDKQGHGKADNASDVTIMACAEDPYLKVHKEEIDTGGDKIEAINDRKVSEHDHDKANDAANVSMLACVKELNPKVHEEEIKTGDTTEVINDINISELDHSVERDVANISRLACAEEPNLDVHKEEIETGGDKNEVINDINVSQHDHDMATDAATMLRLECSEEPNLKVQEEEIKTGGDKIEVAHDINVEEHDHNMAIDTANISRLAYAEEPNLEVHQEGIETGCDKTEVKSDINADEHEESMAYNAANVPRLACAEEPSLKVHEEEVQAGGDKTEVINDMNVDEHDNAMANDAEKISTPVCAEESSLNVHEEEIKTGGDQIEAANDINVGERDHDMANDAANVPMLACAEESNLQVHEEEIDTRGDKIETSDDMNIGEHDHNMATDAANVPMLACAEEPNLKVHEEEIETRNDKIEAINGMSVPKEEIQKGDEKVEIINYEFNHISMKGERNKKSEMSSLWEFEPEAPESINSSDKLKHDNCREDKLMNGTTEVTSTVNVAEHQSSYSNEEATSEASSKNGKIDHDKLENPSSNMVTDGASTQGVAIEAEKNLEDTSSIACKEKNKDIYETTCQEVDAPPNDGMDKAEDSAWFNRDDRGANEEVNSQTGLSETTENSKSNPENHDRDKGGSWQANEEQGKLGVHVILIPEKTEIAAPRENAQKNTEESIHLGNYEQKKEEDEPTSTSDCQETLFSADKSLPLVDSITETESEEMKISQKNADDLNSKNQPIENLRQADTGETGDDSKNKPGEENQEPSKTYAEYDKQAECQSGELKIIPDSSENTEKLEKLPESYFDEKLEINTVGKIIPEEARGREEATDKQLDKAAAESVCEDGAPLRLFTTESIRDEAVDPSFQGESLKDAEPTLIDNDESHRAENNVDLNIEVLEAFDQPTTTGSEDISKQDFIEGSVEETTSNFQDNEKKSFNLGEEDPSREIEEENCVCHLPPEFIQNFNELQCDRTDENILCESNQNAKNPENVFDVSSNKIEQSCLGEHDNSTEATTKEEDEYAYSINVAEDDGEKCEIEKKKDNDTEVTLKSEEDLKQMVQNDGKDKLEEFPDKTFEGSKGDASRENSENTTYTAGEETLARPGNISQEEKKEEKVKAMDVRKDNIAAHQEVHMTTGASEATTENIIKVCEPSKTEASLSKPEEEIENTVGTLSGEDKSDETKMKEEVEVRNIESKEQNEATHLIERKISNKSDDFSDPRENLGHLTSEEINNNLIENSSPLRVLEKERCGANNSETEVLSVVSENAPLQEFKPVIEEQLDSSDAAPEMLHVTTIETKTNNIGSVDISERQEEKNNSEENSKMEVLGEADEGKDQLSHCDKDKAQITGINQEKELTISTTLLEDQLVYTFMDSSMVPSREEPNTIEMSKITEKTPARNDILFVDAEKPLKEHSKGASMFGSAGTEDENANEGIQKHMNKDQPMHDDLKTENDISDFEVKDQQERETFNGLADQYEAGKLEIVQDKKSTIEVSKHIEVVTYTNSEKDVLEEEELAVETEDSSAVIPVEREATELKAGSPSSEEETDNTKNSEILTEKGLQYASVARDQSDEKLLNSSNNQTEGEGNNIQVHHWVETVDNHENIKEQLTEGRMTSDGKETEHKVKVSTSEFTEQTGATVLSKESESVTLQGHMEQNMDIIDFRASESTDASETCTEDSCSTSKGYEKDTEAEVFKKDEPVNDDPKNVPVIVVIEETGMKKVGPEHEEYEKGSDVAIQNEGATAIVKKMTTTDSIYIDERKEEQFTPEKRGILEEANKGHLKMDTCVEETDHSTTVQHEREVTTSSILMFQDYPRLSIEEKDTMKTATSNTINERPVEEENTDETAESYTVGHPKVNKLLQKEHEVAKPGGVYELDSADITKDCSYEDNSKLEDEDLHMLSHQNNNSSIFDTSSVAHQPDPCKSDSEKEEGLLIEASMHITSSTCKDGEAIQGQENLATIFEGSLTGAAMENIAMEFKTEDSRHEHEPTDDFPAEKTVEAADINEMLKLASESMAKEQSDEKLYQTREKSNTEDQILESRENIHRQEVQAETKETTEMQFKVEHHISVPRENAETDGCTRNVLEGNEKAHGSENIPEQTSEPRSIPKELDMLSAENKRVTELQVTATNSGLLQQIEHMNLMEERTSDDSESETKPNEGFSSLAATEASEEEIHKEESKKVLFRTSSLVSQEVENNITFNKKDDTNINFETQIGLNEIKEENIKEVDNEGGQEKDQENRDEAPTTGFENEKEEDASLTLISNDNLQDPYVTKKEENNPSTEEISNSIDKNLTRDDQTYQDSKTPFVVHTAEKKLPQSNHNEIEPEVTCELVIAVIEKENANKEIQKPEDETLNRLCDLNTQETIPNPEVAEISRKRGSDSTDENEADTVEVKDQKPCFEALKDIVDETCKDDENDAEKFRSSTKIIVSENIVTELDPGGQGDKHDSTKTEKSELPAEILETASGDETNEQLQQSKNKSDNIQDSISESVTKQVHDRVDLASGSENIEEQIIDSEVSSIEIQISSASDEAVNQVKDQYLISTKNLKATDSGEPTVVLDSNIGDDPTKKGAASATEALEENIENIVSRGVIDESREGLQSIKGKLEEKIQVERDHNFSKTDSIPLEVLKVEACTMEAQLDKITLKKYNLHEQCPETIKAGSSLQADEDISMKAEQTCMDMENRTTIIASDSGAKINEHNQRGSSSEVQEKGRDSEVILQLEPHDRGEKENIDSLTESEQNKEPTRSEEASYLYVQEVQSHEVLTKLGDKKHLNEATTGLQPEENLSEKTTAATEAINTQVSDEKIKEDKDRAKDCQQISLDERNGKSQKESELNVFCPIKKTDETVQSISNDNQQEQKSESFKRENEYIEDSLPDDIDGKNVTESAMRLYPTNRGTETNSTGRITEAMAQDEKELGVDRSQKGHMDSAEVSGDTQEIQKLVESSGYQNLTVKADVESNYYWNRKPDENENELQVSQQPNEETILEVQPKTEKTVRATEVGEEHSGYLAENLTEESSPIIAENISSSSTIQRSAKEPLQVATYLDKVTELALCTGKGKTPEAETLQFEETTLISEKEGGGDECGKIDPLSGASVSVEISKDKVSHKKSHNILSGVGSKVKHSISKVKKAITGKSSHPKTQSPK